MPAPIESSSVKPVDAVSITKVSAEAAIMSAAVTSRPTPT